MCGFFKFLAFQKSVECPSQACVELDNLLIATTVAIDLVMSWSELLNVNVSQICFPKLV